MTSDLIRERLWTYAYALRGAAEANRQRASKDTEVQGLVAVADMVAADLDALAALVGEGEVNRAEAGRALRGGDY